MASTAVGKVKSSPEFNSHLIEKGMQMILRGMGCDMNDRNYLMTPERYAKALREMFEPEETDWATFQEEYNDFILLRGHELFSLCPHHMFPVRMRVSVAYVPGRNVLGLSKLARVLHEVNRGPLLQEAFTKSVCDKIADICGDVKGVGCLVQGVHGCLQMRGVKSCADFVTHRVTGVLEQANLQDRFFQLATMQGGFR